MWLVDTSVSGSSRTSFPILSKHRVTSCRDGVSAPRLISSSAKRSTPGLVKCGSR